jgi:hypothetical protein
MDTSFTLIFVSCGGIFLLAFVAIGGCGTVARDEYSSPGKVGADHIRRRLKHSIHGI